MTSHLASMAGLVTVLFLLMFPHEASAEQSVLSYLYQDFQNPNDRKALANLIGETRTSPDLSADHAYSRAEDILSEQPPVELEAEAVNPMNLAAGRWLANAAIFDTHAGRPDQGQIFLTEALAMLGADSTPFSPHLFNSVIARGIAAYQLDDFEQAREDFHWGQNILHRNEGVLTFSQAEILNWLTRVHLSNKELFKADTQQRFLLRVAEEHFEDDHETLTAIKQNVAEYLGQRASLISPLEDEPTRAVRQAMFAESLTLLEELIETLEQRAGFTSIELIKPLRALARIRHLQGTGFRLAEGPLERVLSILQSQENLDDEDLAQAWLDLGDGRVLSGNPSSQDAYREAWTLLASSTPEAIERFNAPVMLLPKKITPLYLERWPTKTEPGEALYTDLSLIVTEEGKTKGVKIIDRTVSAKYSRWARSRLSYSRFRPAVQDGEPVSQTIELRQPFEVLEKASEERDEAEKAAVIDDSSAAGS
jgi:hypothetical protein